MVKFKEPSSLAIYNAGILTGFNVNIRVSNNAVKKPSLNKLLICFTTREPGVTCGKIPALFPERCCSSELLQFFMRFDGLPPIDPKWLPQMTGRCPQPPQIGLFVANPAAKFGAAPN
ncbi:hypothetical protein Ahy_B02g058000 isoform B [Arachis hypogaea]|uniref:Uncharacterized protein n=1 Tax=Arachis hypogaea TaxID=3818 RepID=A0A445ADJ8_ARAHY|nr:hypothetical protein Ahy_B02g058000 isoform B [Arachis hypogaea]